MGMHKRKTPAMAMAVLRLQYLGLQLGPPVMVHTFCLKSPEGRPWPPSTCPCSPPPMLDHHYLCIPHTLSFILYIQSQENDSEDQKQKNPNLPNFKLHIWNHFNTHIHIRKHTVASYAYVIYNQYIYIYIYEHTPKWDSEKHELVKKIGTWGITKLKNELSDTGRDRLGYPVRHLLVKWRTVSSLC